MPWAACWTKLPGPFQLSDSLVFLLTEAHCFRLGGQKTPEGETLSSPLEDEVTNLHVYGKEHHSTHVFPAQESTVSLTLPSTASGILEVSGLVL